MNRKENPITKRSKKYIVNAMMDLLQEKSFEKITIKEIMEKAEMARRTFYGNFASKEEIIQYYFQNLFHRLEERLSAEGKFSPGKMAETLFELVLEDKDNMMVAKNRGLINMARVESYSTGISELFKKTSHIQGSHMALNYATEFYLGGVWQVMDQWLGEGAKDSPKKMADMFQNIISGNIFGGESR